jgi:transposase
MPTITLKLELYKPTKQKQQMYADMTRINTAFANWLIMYNDLGKASSATFKQFSEIRFPSAVACETVRIVKSQVRHQEAKFYKRLWCGFNNQNLRIERQNNGYVASFPTLEKRIGVPLVTRDYQHKHLERLLAGNAKQGTAKLICRKGKWYLLVSLSWEDSGVVSGNRVMGIDLGLRNLAVAAIGTHTVFFAGKQAAYIRRRYNARRKKLGQAKKLSAIRKLADKESRWMRNHNHVLSRRIVDLAVAYGVV